MAKTLDPVDDLLEGASNALTAVRRAAATPARSAKTVVGVPSGAPSARTGEDPLSSRGFRISKAIALQAGLVAPEHAKIEIDAMNGFRSALTETNGVMNGTDRRAMLLPLGSQLLSDDVTHHDGYRVFKSLWSAGQQGVDLDEVQWMARNGSGLVRKAAMSYLSDTTGGTLVPPPVQGELIELMRPKEALRSAGATMVPLPPNGKIVYPRLTGPTTMYWVGENTALTESNPTTGQVSLQAKKGAVLVTVPNELLLYASVAGDTLIRNDLSKTLALGVDYASLYGLGGPTQPKGLTLYTGTNEVIDYAGVTPAPVGVRTNGNQLRPEDGYRMIGLIEDRNFEFSGWIFRPSHANNVAGFRADAAAVGDAAGAFVASMMRSLSDRQPMDTWCGYKATKSAVVLANYTKGSGSSLTEVFGGQWEHWLIGMYGAVEIASSNQAGNTFSQDQTQIRGLIHCDAVPRYEGAFIRYKQLSNTTNQA